MAITPPTDAELREAALLRLRLLGVDLSVLPTSTTDPNPTNSPTQEAVIAACVRPRRPSRSSPRSRRSSPRTSPG